MNWDQVEGKWKQYAGKAKEKWGKLTDDDIEVVRGRRDQLVGKIQERYGIVREEAEKQVDEFAKAYRIEAAKADVRQAERDVREEEVHPRGQAKKHSAGQP